MTQTLDNESIDRSWRSLYKIAGIASLLACCANLLDVVLGFGDTEIVGYGTRTAADWFALYHENWFKGIYTLGILNIVYQVCLIPVYLAMVRLHRRTNQIAAMIAMILFLIGLAVYASNNAAIPMLALSGKYAAATSDAQKTILAAAGEATLAAGEDFTPGSFIGLICGGLAAIVISFVMLRGGHFGKSTAWIGIAGFSFLSIFIVWYTFIPVLSGVAYYLFGMCGGLLALAWFVRVGWRLLSISAGTS